MGTTAIDTNVLYTVIGILGGVIATMFVMMRKDSKDDKQKYIQMQEKATEAIINNNIITKGTIDALRENTNFLIAIKTIFESTKKL